MIMRLNVLGAFQPENGNIAALWQPSNADKHHNLRFNIWQRIVNQQQPASIVKSGIIFFPNFAIVSKVNFNIDCN